MIKSVVWALCVLAILGSVQLNAQNVTTWHNDNYRTGWQQNETTLTATGTGHVSQSNFGLLWQWQVTGTVVAQPLAVTGVQTNNTNCQPCNLVFIATEKDMLYAFSAGSPQTPPVWSVNLATSVATTDTAVDCGSLQIAFGPCNPPPGVLGNNIGQTGTPVIDTTTNPYTLYVAGAVETSTTSIAYYLFAVDITSGAVQAKTQIGGTVSGNPPALKCHTTYPAQGQVSFDYNHIQRSALLLLNGVVYVPFAPAGDETENGWIFGYSFNGSAFSPSAVFATTPYGTGGGIWQAGAGLASETRGGSSYIYTVTGNGTTYNVGTATPIDMGDTLLKLNPFNNGSFSVTDYYTPSDVFSYPGSNGNGNGRCQNDVDFGSGGVLVFPDAFYYDQNNRDYPNLVVNADKESKLYVANRDSLGKFSPSGGNNIQAILTPALADGKQGYWSSPAYWKYTDQNGPHYMLYYSATTETKRATPYPINGYQLLTTGSSGPIPSTPTLSTTTLFCFKSPTPSVSSNGTGAGTGIVWAIENGNSHNIPPTPTCDGARLPAALHAFDATNLATELYSSRTITTTIGNKATFSTPTIFQSRVYMGTLGEVNVFGLCSSQTSGCLP